MGMEMIDQLAREDGLEKAKKAWKPLLRALVSVKTLDEIGRPGDRWEFCWANELIATLGGPTGKELFEDLLTLHFEDIRNREPLILVFMLPEQNAGRREFKAVSIGRSRFDSRLFLPYVPAADPEQDLWVDIRPLVNQGSYYIPAGLVIRHLFERIYDRGWDVLDNFRRKITGEKFDEIKEIVRTVIPLE